MSYWDERYSADGFVFGEAPNRFVAHHAGMIPPGSNVFVPGDGEGRNGVHLACLGHHVTSIDLSRVGVDKARRFAAARGVDITIEQADIAFQMWPAETWDAVVAVFIQFAEPPLRAAIFSGIKRALKPGGLVLLHGYTPKQLEFGTGGPSSAAQMYTEDLLREAFAGFEILELRAYEAELDEGHGHKGRSALIDLVARKPAG